VGDPLKPAEPIDLGLTSLGGGATSVGGAETYSFLEPASEPGDLGRLAHYRVLRLLGAGGMGFVFEAEDTQLARRVALKVMKPDLASGMEYRERFLREARAAAAVTSDYIVTVYQVGLAGDVPFQAIQLLTGESLQARLQRAGPLPVGLACLVLRQVAEGLAAAHEKGLTHRDIKPANIWLESARPGGPFRRAKILDFGLARAGGGNTHLTGTGVIIGTPHYMSPEQASAQPLDGRADIFSLGCVAYTMLTGEIAFDGSTTMAIMMALATHTPPLLTAKNPSVPVELSDLVASMMAKEPEGRPATATDVSTRLDAILATIPGPHTDSGEPADAGAPPPSPRSNRPAAATTVVPVTVLTPVSSPTPAPSAPSPTRTRWLVAGGVGLVALLAVALSILLGKRDEPKPPDAGLIAGGEPIPVGVVHSLNGTMAISESPVVDATILAIDEVNAAGGVLGRKLVPVVVDGRSDPAVFEKETDRLLTEHKAPVVFGCWTSASRKAVRPVVERHNALLFYPVQYEGLEQSPRVVYLGPAANQQLTPAVEFLVLKEGKKRLFLVGSDYVFPRAAHEIVKDQAKAKSGAQVVGEVFLPLGTKDVAQAVAAIKAAAPDAILNTINGTTNFHFFRELNADPGTAGIPVLSVSFMEPDLRTLDPKAVAGDFLAGAYFEGVGSPSANAFLEKLRKRFGQEQRYSDPLAAAYCGVHLWAKAANACGSLDPDAVAKALRGMTFDGPVGPIRIDPETLHSWLPLRIGRVRADGTVEAVEGSAQPVRPEPFPPTRSRADWDRFLNDLYLRWDGRWQPPELK
jgi:urea transport system substrate-binding protein